MQWDASPQESCRLKFSAIMQQQMTQSHQPQLASV
jgi:hypothetical protein